MTDNHRCFYQKHTVYGITFNPNDATQLYGIESDRLTAVVERVRRILINHLKPVAQYVLITEVSEPVETRKDHGYPRIHFHGIVRFRNPIRYLTERLHHLGKVFSIVVHPYDREKWTDYCAKQKDLLAPELGPAYYQSDKDTVCGAFGATSHVG